jgi:hypothetical protein
MAVTCFEIVDSESIWVIGGVVAEEHRRKVLSGGIT